MVEQDAVGGVQAIGFAVIDRDPVAVQFGRGIGRAGIERRGLALWDFLYLAVQFRGRGLIKPNLLFHLQYADGFQQPQHPDGVGVGRVFRGLETDLNMALRRQIVYLVRLKLLNQANQIGGIGHVAKVHEKFYPGFMRVLIQVIHAPGIERRRAPLYPMNLVALTEE